MTWFGLFKELNSRMADEMQQKHLNVERTKATKKNKLTQFEIIGGKNTNIKCFYLAFSASCTVFVSFVHFSILFIFIMIQAFMYLQSHFNPLPSPSWRSFCTLASRLHNVHMLKCTEKLPCDFPMNYITGNSFFSQRSSEKPLERGWANYGPGTYVKIF